MWDVIRERAREGTTILLTTQYLEEADELAHSIAVVDAGRIIARGTADELKSQIGGERIEVFVPPQTLPSWLRPVAERNPVSALTASTRELWGNPNPFAAEGFPAKHPILLTLIWVVVIVAVFAPLGCAGTA